MTTTNTETGFCQACDTFVTFTVMDRNDDDVAHGFQGRLPNRVGECPTCFTLVGLCDAFPSAPPSSRCNEAAVVTMTTDGANHPEDFCAEHGADFLERRANELRRDGSIYRLVVTETEFDS